MDKLIKAVKQTGINEVSVSGGVSANSGLQNAMRRTAKNRGWKLHIPKISFTMDNAAMIAIAGYYKYQKKEFIGLDAVPFARMNIKE